MQTTNPSQADIDDILAAIRMGAVEALTLEPLIWVEILICQAEAKMEQATGAVKHIWAMAKQYGDDHPVTVQARQFATQLNNEAVQINTVARKLHEANKAFLQQNVTFY
jgi:hypothetical protein